MTIELSTITFTDQDDIVPLSGVEQILNTGVANALAATTQSLASFTIPTTPTLNTAFSTPAR